MAKQKGSFDLKGRRVDFGSFESKQSAATIYYKSNRPQSPDGKRKDLNIFIFHDFYDYHDRYLELGDFLVTHLDQNVSLFLMDFAGHGHSSGTRNDVGLFEDFCLDSLQFLNKIHHRYSAPSLLFGQGMGALVLLKLIDHILNFKEEEKLDFLGMIYANPLLNFNYETPSWNVPFKQVFAPFVSRLKIPLGTKPHQLCADPIKNREMLADGLINTQLTWGMVSEIFEAARSVRRSSYYLNYPSLFLVSEDDFLTSAQKIYLFQKGLPRNLATYRSYAEAKHDLVNDVRREVVFNDIVRWIKKLTGESRS